MSAVVKRDLEVPGEITANDSLSAKHTNDCVTHWCFYDPQRQVLLSHLHHEEPLSGHTERDLFPNLAVFGKGFEFDHLPCLRLHLHAVGERIHRHHGCQHRPCHLS